MRYLYNAVNRLYSRGIWHQVNRTALSKASQSPPHSKTNQPTNQTIHSHRGISNWCTNFLDLLIYKYFTLLIYWNNNYQMFNFHQKNIEVRYCQHLTLQSWHFTSTRLFIMLVSDPCDTVSRIYQTKKWLQ